MTFEPKAIDLKIIHNDVEYVLQSEFDRLRLRFEEHQMIAANATSDMLKANYEMRKLKNLFEMLKSAVRVLSQTGDENAPGRSFAQVVMNEIQRIECGKSHGCFWPESEGI